MLNIFDKILIVALITFAISFNFIITNASSQNDDIPNNNLDSNVIVTINNETYNTYDLSKNGIHTVNIYNSFNKFEIKDGYVKMIDANCNDKLCLSQRKINNNFETIVCLPHKLIIEVDNNTESKIDSIAQ